jgi:hypothetical protein
MKTSLASQIIQKLDEKRKYEIRGCVKLDNKKRIYSYKRDCYFPTKIRGRPSVHGCDRANGERYSYTKGVCYKTTSRQAKSETN